MTYISLAEDVSVGYHDPPSIENKPSRKQGEILTLPAQRRRKILPALRVISASKFSVQRGQCGWTKFNGSHEGERRP